jgi:hypothetical protein
MAGKADERMEAIYAIAGDALTICISRKKYERPTAFESKEGSNYLLIVLKREPRDEEKKGGTINDEKPPAAPPCS